MVDPSPLIPGSARVLALLVSLWAARALTSTRSRARAAAGVNSGGSSGSITRMGLRLSP